MIHNITETLNKITQNWFLAEPLLFSVFCTHDFLENPKLQVPFRTGKKRIEYNSSLLENLSIHEISELLKIEVFRILLKHPYQRQPVGAKKPYLAIASDATIYANYETDVKLEGVEIIKDIIDRITILKDGYNLRQKTLTTESDKFSQAAAPLKIPAAALNDYLLRREAIKIEAVTDGYTAVIDKSRYLFQFQNDENEGDFYQVMKWNALLQKYSNVYGAGIFQFWKETVTYEKGEIILPENLCFEEWYTKILIGIQTTSQEGDEKIEDGNQNGENSQQYKNKDKQYEFDNLSQVSQLWEEDDQTQQLINDLIDDAEKSEQWGSVSGDIKELIQANRKIDMNYAEILRHFGTSIIASKRTLTRKKPNRRFGFDRLGSRYNLSSNLLIAVDVSSSISKENLEYVFSIINLFFKYGVEKIDVIQFDTKIQGDVMEINQALEYIQIGGRGGTDFQPAADFYCNNKAYDGMIFFTDGFGPHPKFDGRSKVDVLWIFTTKEYYEKGKKWADLIPGNNSTFIPLN